ncbi:hypothetical protein AB0P37_23075, partial [Streptomyces antimycoticus]
MILPLGLSAPAAAGDRTPGPAPACVAMYESWRYTDAANNCADTVDVMVVNAKVHVPGLAGVPLISVEQVTSKAVCAAGK